MHDAKRGDAGGHLWQGEITCALASDDATRLARALVARDPAVTTRHREAIDLAEVVASLSALGGAAGIVSPTERPVDRGNLLRVCRRAASAMLPEGPLALLELALFYGAHRCFDLLAAGGARIDPSRAESLLVDFLDTRAWREAVACWGSCALLKCRRDERLVYPMVTVRGPGCGSRVRLFDPLPVVERLLRFIPPGDIECRERLASAVRAATAAARESGRICRRAPDPNVLAGVVCSAAAPLCQRKVAESDAGTGSADGAYYLHNRKDADVCHRSSRDPTIDRLPLSPDD